MSMKKSNDTIGNRPRDVPVCSAVPQPTAPARAPSSRRYRMVYTRRAGMWITIGPCCEPVRYKCSALCSQTSSYGLFNTQHCVNLRAASVKMIKKCDGNCLMHTEPLCSGLSNGMCSEVWTNRRSVYFDHPFITLLLSQGIVHFLGTPAHRGPTCWTLWCA
jgi:hypothetical protein